MLPIKPIDTPLYVIAVISNPVRYRTRYHLYREFAEYIEKSGAILYTVELAFGGRAFEITDATNPRHIQVRTWSELWHKENLINIGISRLPPDWEYVAWIDADVKFARHDWVSETKHLLQHYMFVQMFSKAVDLDPQNEPISGIINGFVWSWLNHEKLTVIDYGMNTYHPGYAWAARREAIDHVGGLIDWAILGAGDRHMACSLIGKVEVSFYPDIKKACPTYAAWCLEWQNRCTQYIVQDIGYMDGLLMHAWHGPKSGRQYTSRWRILIDNKFDPVFDLKKDSQGVWQLTDYNLKLRDGIRRYFRSRNEDSIDM